MGFSCTWQPVSKRKLEPTFLHFYMLSTPVLSAITCQNNVQLHLLKSQSLPSNTLLHIKTRKNAPIRTVLIPGNLTLFPWLHSHIPGACIPKRANGSLPMIISPITSSLKTDRKEATCLWKQNKNMCRYGFEYSSYT